MNRRTLSPLHSLSPLDGRYLGQLDGFAESCFSEFALMRTRLEVELEWFERLLVHPRIGGLRRSPRPALQRILDGFSLADAEAIKRIEKRIGHDMKAIEVWLQKSLRDSPLANRLSLIHFGCTTYDIHNIALSLMVKRALAGWHRPAFAAVRSTLASLSRRYASCAMLARTHGQPASPTTLGKELSVFAHRLDKAIQALNHVGLEGKMNGAVGNYNAHVAAYPGINWLRLTQAFVRKLGLKPNLHTTQIEPYDSLAQVFDCIARANTVLVDLSRDMWSYISMDYLRQKTDPDEVGSSTMPHKVNPIDFENAEGNLGLSTALLRHLSDKLPVSRLQRDLSDSTVSRNIGVAIGHSLLALKSLQKGLAKIEPNRSRMKSDLDGSWEVLAEAAMSVMRSLGDADAYETMRRRTRGKGSLDREAFHGIIKDLPLPAREKERLLALTPADYLGLAKMLARL